MQKKKERNGAIYITPWICVCVSKQSLKRPKAEDKRKNKLIFKLTYEIIQVKVTV